MAKRQECSRREILGGVAGLSAVVLGIMTGGCELFQMTTQRIQNRPIRRNLASLALTDPIITTLANAVTAMKGLPSSDPRNWINQANIHRDFCPHGNWWFLPWHRFYLYYFEEICRELTGQNDFALPYWNWTANPSIPSIYWSGTLFDSTRAATAASVADPGAVGSAVMDSILNQPNFLLFASGTATGQRDFSTYGVLEGTPHNYVHGFVGGDMGFVSLSPRDPVFWAHHNMVECCWVNWNIIRNHPNTSDSQWTRKSFTEFVDRHGNPVTVSVQDCLLFPIFLYQYEECFPGPRSMREAEQQLDLQTFLKRGAAVRLEMREPVEVEIAVGLELRQPLQRQLHLPERMLDRVLLDSLDSDHLILTIDNVVLPSHSDFYVRVFVNKPDATSETPIHDPQYAGSFALFNGSEAEQSRHPSAKFIVDLTMTVKRLWLSKMVERHQLELTLVAVPHSNRTVKDGVLRLKRLVLAVSSSPRLQ